MKKPAVDGERLAAAFVLGCLLFNYPILSLFSAEQEIFGVSLLFAYLFATWAALIALLARIVEKHK